MGRCLWIHLGKRRVYELRYQWKMNDKGKCIMVHLIIRAKSLLSRVKKVEILKTQLDLLNILGPYIQFLD
jgi:hypothetical protein